MIKNFSKAQRDLEYVGVVLVLWSTLNNILYLNTIKRQHGESEGPRKLDQRTIGGVFRVAQMQTDFLKQGCMQNRSPAEVTKCVNYFLNSPNNGKYLMPFQMHRREINYVQ